MKSIDHIWSGLIGSFRGSGVCRFKAAPGLDSQVQRKFAVNAVYPLVIPALVLDVAKIVKALAETPVTLFLGQLDQPIGDLDVLITESRLIPVAGLADPERRTG